MGLHPAPHTSLLTSLSSYHRPAVAYCSMSSDKGSSRVPATCPADHEPVIPTENNPNHRLPDQLLYIYIDCARSGGGGVLVPVLVLVDHFVHCDDCY